MMQVHRETEWQDLDGGQSPENSAEAMWRLAAFTYERVRRSDLGHEVALQAAVYSVVLVSDDMPNKTVSQLVLHAIAWVKSSGISAVSTAL